MLRLGATRTGQSDIAAVRGSWADGFGDSLHQTLTKAVHAFETFLDVRHAGGITEADAIICAEGNSGDSCNFFGFKQFRAKVGRVEAGFPDVRKEVECAFGVNAGNSRNAVQLFPCVGPALVEFRKPAFQMILGSGQRRDGAFLGEGSWVAGAMALNGVNGFCDRLGRGEKSEPPAGHAPGFGEAVDDNGVFVMGRRKAGDAFMGRAVVKQMLVNFVAHDEDAFFDANVAESFNFFRGVDGAGRIAGGIEDEKARARCNGGAQLRGCDLEFSFVAGLENDGRGAGKLDHFGITEPIRRGNQDFVTLLAGRNDEVVTGMFAAAGDNDLGGLVSKPVLAFEFVGDGLA